MDFDMATIGTFASNGNGFTGTVKTLALNIKATFLAVDKESDKAPDYRIHSNTINFGAA
jgi:uncharacterized protein (DUF736 family)